MNEYNASAFRGQSCSCFIDFAGSGVGVLGYTSARDGFGLDLGLIFDLFFFPFVKQSGKKKKLAMDNALKSPIHIPIQGGF